MTEEVFGLDEVETSMPQVSAATDGLPIGTILPSILPPEAFFRFARPERAWALADGMPLADQRSPLADFMKRNNQRWYDNRMVENDVAKTPNLNGVFLRGVDVSSKENEGDTDGKRKIGSFQKDAFKRHSLIDAMKVQASMHFDEINLALPRLSKLLQQKLGMKYKLELPTEAAKKNQEATL